MWLQRVIFNVRHRLLSQGAIWSSDAHPSKTPPKKTEEKRAQVILDRLLDLDERCANLKSR